MTAAALPGHLSENVMHFARVLRGAGMPVGTDRILLALEALTLAGLESREDFRATLAACLIDRADHIPLFDQAFALFWRDPDLLGRMMSMLLPKVEGPGALPPPENRRLADALFPQLKRNPPPQEEDEIEVDATLTFSEREILRRADFETMTAEEWQKARAMLANLDVFFERIATRRTRPAHAPGRLDWRATLKARARGGDNAALQWKKPRTRHAPLVVLADISGSMSKYSRMLLHFVHALASPGKQGRPGCNGAFVFGTRLTNITRAMRRRDPDLAVAAAVNSVADWSGGTRISVCLHDFNHHWSRRVLAQNATVLLISDGLEHGDTAALAFEMERLSKSCQRLVWLNPLLRYQGFEPRAAGIRAMLPHVDLFLSAHNIESLEQLASILAGGVEHQPRSPASPASNRANGNP